MTDRHRPASGTVAPTLVALSLVVLAACAGGERPRLTDTTVAAGECTGAGLEFDLDDRGLPAPIARTRGRLVDALVACDTDRLQRLADRAPLDVSINGAAVPIDEWIELEAEGLAVFRVLAGLLSLPAAELDGGGRAWPTAVEWPFADTAPPGERRALEAIVGPSGIFGWAETGAYAGWRTTIAPSGAWAHVALGPTD